MDKPQAKGSHLYQVGGSISKENTIYIEREADKELFEALQQGELCYIFNSRQMGKSSLLVHVKSRLQDEGFLCCFLDLSRIGSVNVTSEQWFAGIISELWRGFNLPAGNAMLEWWQSLGDVTPAQKLADFFQNPLLHHHPDQRLVVFFDEVDSVLSLPFQADDFFSVVRAIYNQRPEVPALNQLSFSFFGVALPSQLIEDKKRSPFNIGKSISLEGFTAEEAGPLAQGLQAISDDPKSLLQYIYHWTRGQPFLTQKLCKLLAAGNPVPKGSLTQEWIDQWVYEHIIQDWQDKDNPEHLRTIRDRVLLDQDYGTVILSDYAAVLAQADSGVAVSELDDVSRLYLTGLIAIHKGIATPRTNVYQQVFNGQWVESALEGRRPYQEKMQQWQAGGDEQWLLSPDELQAAQAWAQGKHLPESDHLFLSASQSRESRSYQALSEQLSATLEQLESAKQQVEGASKAKSDFLARVSHEVRTPINSVLGLSRLALQQDLGGIGRDYVQKIYRSTGYMLNVINDIVDISRIERGELSLSPAPFYLDDLLDRLIEVVAPRAHDKGLQLQLNTPKQNLPKLLGDEERLEQLLVNLMTNAIKHTNKGQVSLTVQYSEASMIQFVIRDSGVGVSKHPVAGQVTNTPDSVLATGLGLSLCCELVELMGGSLSLDSVPGDGASFTANIAIEVVEATPDIATEEKTVALLGIDTFHPVVADIQAMGQSIVMHGDSNSDILLFDGNNNMLLTELKQLSTTYPQRPMIALLKAGQPMPEHLLKAEVAYRVDYPISRRRLAETLEGAMLPVDRSARLIPVQFKPGYQVLVADDDPMNCIIVKELLSQAGLLVETVDNGEKAIRKLENQHFDLVLMDIEMPVMGGLEAISLIRESAWGKTLPVIAMTAHALVEDSQRFIEAGMSSHLSKPIDPVLLWKTLRQWMPDNVVTQNDGTEGEKRLLVIDDQPENIRLMMEILQQDYKVIAATSGAKALDLLTASTRPDAILLDIYMPEMDGFEVCQAIKSNPRTQDIPIIFVSGSESAAEFEKGFSLGAYDFISKPVNPSLLLARVNHCVNHS